jgi:AcrR family transcriptional regulator
MSDEQRRVRASDVATRAEATRAALVATARRLFVENGYHATGTTDVVAQAGAGTRGALYHHFPDKRSLFLAVFHEVEQDLLAGAAANVTASDALTRLRTGLNAFLDASLTKEVQRVILIDARPFWVGRSGAPWRSTTDSVPYGRCWRKQ